MVTWLSYMGLVAATSFVVLGVIEVGFRLRFGRDYLRGGSS